MNKVFEQINFNNTEQINGPIDDRIPDFWTDIASGGDSLIPVLMWSMVATGEQKQQTQASVGEVRRPLVSHPERQLSLQHTWKQKRLPV